MSKRYLFPYELIEVNWRFWSFLAILAAGFGALIMFPLLQVNGYIDPFYSPTVLIVPLPGAFRLTCYAYRKDYHRHLFRHPLGCSNPDRSETHEQPYTGERSAIFQIGEPAQVLPLRGDRDIAVLLLRLLSLPHLRR